VPLLGDDLPGPFTWSHVWQWHFEFVPIALLGAATVAYLLGVWRVDGWPTYRPVCFVGGAVATFVAVQSVLGIYDDVLFADHMVQHLMLVMMAAPLFAAGAPLDLASAALRGRPKRAVDAFIDGPVGGVVLHPLFGLIAYAAFIPITHLSGLMNVTLENEQFHDLEHVGFLVVGYLFFRHVFAIERGPVTLHPGLRLVFLMLAVPIDTITGLALAMSSHNPFPALAAAHRTWGPSVLSDVRTGGAIMWIGGDGLMLLALIPATVIWVRYEDRRAIEIDAELDAQAEAARAATAASPTT
jgi:cytochrome c oxidase assembly factor CtaG